MSKQQWWSPTTNLIHDEMGQLVQNKSKRYLFCKTEYHNCDNCPFKQWETYILYHLNFLQWKLNISILNKKKSYFN